MHLHLRAIGKLKEKSALELLTQYHKRLPWKLSIAEHEVKHYSTAQERKEAEGAWLLSGLAKSSLLIALDERGKSYDSIQFAHMLQQWREQHGDVTFVIGGADGLSDAVKTRAHSLISFGALTWPHQLVRIMLVEQLYRASTILSGHPYHRA